MYQLNQLKIIKHTMSIQYVCPNNGATHSVKLNDPIICNGKYFEDWSYQYIEFKCKFCGNTHKMEI